MRFEIKGDNVSFQNAPKKGWLPITIQFINGDRTFWVERSERLEEIRIVLDDGEKVQ
jgi:hypothetical protein